MQKKHKAGALIPKKGKPAAVLRKAQKDEMYCYQGIFYIHDTQICPACDCEVDGIKHKGVNNKKHLRVPPCKRTLGDKVVRKRVAKEADLQLEADDQDMQ